MLHPIGRRYFAGVCDRCLTFSGRLEGARRAAVSDLLARGWVHVPSPGLSASLLEVATVDGTGRWYCQACREYAP